MTTRSKSNPFQSRTILLTVFAALVTAGTALPQSSSSSGNAVKDPPEGGYSLVDLSVFFGTQWYQIYQGSGGSGQHFFEARPVVGERVTENWSRYVGLEESFTLGFNRLAILPAGGINYVTEGSRNIEYSVVGVFNLLPRDRKFRPYAVLGPAGVTYFASGTVNQPNVGAIPLLPTTFKTETYGALAYGVGATAYINRRIGFQYDLRGYWTPKTADFGLSNVPYGTGSLYIAHVHGESSLQLTTGIIFRFGYHEPPPPPAPAPPPPPPPPAPRANVQAGPIQGARDVCPGDNLRLTVTASGWLPDQTPGYQWSVNNQNVAGGTGAAFNLDTTTSGNKAIRVTVSVPGSQATSGPVNVLVRQAGPPTIQFNVSPTTINYGDRLPLNATARGSDCGGAVTVRYTASAGTITGTTFDSSSMTFDPNGAGQQQQNVTLTATATDTKNQTASANANVTVLYKRPASRTDIVFPNRSSRVNNAAKRYLIETLTPMLRADPNSTVILIGHRDMSETGRAAANLDHERVYNTAAVISAGKGICPALDLSRVQVAYAGTDQTDPPMPFADNSVKERRGATATDQRAQFRRVEVWFIPGGSDRPNVPGLQPAPVREIQAKGCPR